MAGTRTDAQRFVREWSDRGDEKQDTELFWIDLMQSVLGLEDATRRLRFQVRAETDAGTGHFGFADVSVPSAKAIVEQKSLGVDLDRPEVRQGRDVTPVQQALAYANGMPYSDKPRYIVTCNFETFRIYDTQLDPMCRKRPLELRLKDLPSNVSALRFLDGGHDAPESLTRAVSVEAGRVMGRIHDLVAAEFIDPDSEESHHALSVFCTRVMFLMFCEDAGMVEPGLFRDYVNSFNAGHLRKALKDLFVWLDTPESERDPYEGGLLAKFPYMDGGLFRERTEIPQLDETIQYAIATEGCQTFDWSGVDPTVFGSIFEGALSHDARRSGGMHYTSPENIHRVIDPLFLDALRGELDDILAKQNPSARTRALRAYQDKLGSLSFLDPACGSGNFLTEAYVCLRRLENRVLAELQKDRQQTFVFEEVDGSPVKVSLENFHGIEINDFACCVARTALWIAEKQADADTAKITQRVYDELPLRDYGCIVKANALKIDWGGVLPADKCSFVMGNPPFLGARNQSKEQKAELLDVFHGSKNCGNVDYVAGWYMKAAEYIGGNPVRCAFVSTNSICQGEQVANIWKPIWDLGVRIDFAHDTFRWNSQADNQAHVFCVIVGFSKLGGLKRLYHHDDPDADAGLRAVTNLNAYLVDGPDEFIWSRKVPICNAPRIGIGNKPIDDGNYLFTNMEKAEFIKAEPASEPLFHRWLGSKEFINGIIRWCLWLGDLSPRELTLLPHCMERVKAVREYRQSSSSAPTKELAKKPTRFHVENMPVGTSVLIPQTSSSRRIYIPMGFVPSGVFCSNAVRLIPDATLFHFGVLQSQFHNAWMRRTSGRLKDDYQYAASVVYNNFVWPEPTDAQRAGVERCAQAVLDARELYDGSTLADMYDPDNDFLYPELMRAHRELDAAVETAYGVYFNGDEEKIVAHLFRLYAEKVGNSEGSQSRVSGGSY